MYQEALIFSVVIWAAVIAIITTTPKNMRLPGHILGGAADRRANVTAVFKPSTAGVDEEILAKPLAPRLRDRGAASNAPDSGALGLVELSRLKMPVTRPSVPESPEDPASTLNAETLGSQPRRESADVTVAADLSIRERC